MYDILGSGTPDAANDYFSYTVFNTVVKKGRGSFRMMQGQLKQYRDIDFSQVFWNPTNWIS